MPKIHFLLMVMLVLGQQIQCRNFRFQEGQIIGVNLHIHLDPENSANNFGSAITFGASDTSSGENAQAGIYVRSDGTYGTKMYFSTTDAYGVQKQLCQLTIKEKLA